MEDLLLLESAGDYLILESQDGTRFRLMVDDSVRRAARPAATISNSNPVSPREIQDAVRAGESVSQICARTGLPEDYVIKFAQPVLDEIEHVLQMAQATRITLDADRFGEQKVLELRELITDRTPAGQSWSAQKLDGPGWLVELSLEGVDEVAKWHFDLKKLFLTPESVLAAKLSASKTAENVLGGLIPTAPLKNSPDSSNIIPLTPKAFRLEDEGSETVSTETVELVKTSYESPVIVAPISDDAKAVENDSEDDPASASIPEAVAKPELLSETADLLEAIRRKRESNSEQENSTDSPTTPPRSFEPSPEDQTENSESQDPTPPVKKGRASMPSWDEIVFGTKVDDID